jgi:hypothetical protein
VPEEKSGKLMAVLDQSLMIGAGNEAARYLGMICCVMVIHGRVERNVNQQGAQVPRYGSRSGNTLIATNSQDTNEDAWSILAP